MSATAGAYSEKASGAQPTDDKSVPPHLRCSSCSRPVFNSYQTPHGCRLCESCVQTKLSPSEKQLCPGKSEACRDEEEEIKISQTSCLPDMATRREIGKLSVFCPNREGGCKEQMKWKDVDAHLEKCEYEKVSCSQCGDSILKKRLRFHLSDECRQRRVKCNLCDVMVVHSEMDKVHKNLDSASCCANFSDYCPYCRDKSRKLTRKEFVEHLKTCPEKPNDCKYAHLGCEVKARKSDLEKHYKDEADRHLLMMDSKLRQLGSLGTLPMAAGGVAMDTTVTGGGGTATDSVELKELKRKVTNIHEHFKKLQVNVANWAHTTLEFEQTVDKFGGISQMRMFLKNLDDKIRHLDSGSSRSSQVSTDSTSISPVQQKLQEIGLRLQNLESTSYDGHLVWKVSNLTHRRREAVERRVTTIFSQPFFSKRNGYKFSVRLHLNGNEAGENSHISVYLILMQHDFDDIQAWPFRAAVNITLINLRNRSDDITKTMLLDSGNGRPSSPQDQTVSCGEAKFLSIGQLENSDRFVKNDSLFIEVSVTSR